MSLEQTDISIRGIFTFLRLAGWQKVFLDILAVFCMLCLMFSVLCFLLCFLFYSSLRFSFFTAAMGRLNFSRWYIYPGLSFILRLFAVGEGIDAVYGVRVMGTSFF